ncbi:uncharacterized protein LOC133986393 [Scomber scombrus]|uniref:uncharacterized protein LOC133986393 n=1 Tax=Scomber scombrus TaxID=13677 RepID=UPI002DD8CDC4|nr:uncharacterized protein LOC133986393 [Scomber scombrus]
MLIVVPILLMLKIGRCTDDHIFATKTVDVGQNVTLTCNRQKSSQSNLFWIRVVSGTFPEILGGTYTFDYNAVDQYNHHITAKQGPGTFVLHITETQLSDTAVYYCINVKNTRMTFLSGTFLRVKGPEPDITAITQDFPSDPVSPRDSVTLQCSVLSDSESKRCPKEHKVFWFRAGSNESHRSLIYAHGNSADECEKSPEARSPKKCVYSFSKNVSSSDSGTYYCAVATCGEILFGNRTKLDSEASVISRSDLQKANTIIYLLCAALAISLAVTAILICIKRKSCDCCNAAVPLQTNTGTASDDQQSQQRNEDSVVYSTAIFTKTAAKTGRRNVNAIGEKCVYSNIRT